MSNKFFVMDTETSGKWPNTARLLSLGVIEAEFTGSGAGIKLPIRASELYFSTFEEVPSEASMVNGLTRAKLKDLSGGKTLDERYDEVAPYLYDDIVFVGYNNASYDAVVLTNNAVNLGWPKPKWSKIVDVYTMAKQYWPKGKIKSHKLQSVYEQVAKEQGKTLEQMGMVFDMFCEGKTEAVAHTAAWDSYMTLMVYLHILKHAK